VRVVVVMGVSGVGKTTVGKGLAAALGWTYAEGDDFHPEANIARMAAGIPLTDEDRWPWLRSIGAWLSDEIAAGRSAVVTCSALRRSYRDVLREGRPEVLFCHLTADPDLIGERVGRRADHYMPASLLPSQLATLKPLEPDEPGFEVPAEGDASVVVAQVREVLGALGLGGSCHPE
jgi:gluconokinase